MTGAAAAEASRPQRLPLLDLLRFVAASADAIYHFAAAPVVNGAVATDTFGALGFAARYGYLGVELFFLISGFVIVMSAMGRTARAFLVNRAVRLYPSFWIGVLLTTVALYVAAPTGDEPPLRQVLANLTMLPGYLGADKIDEVYWTLAVELKFYFLVALCLGLGWSRHFEQLAYAWLGLLLLAEAGVGGGAVRSLAIFPHGSFFCAGALMFLSHRNGWNHWRGLGVLVALALSMRSALRARGDFLPGAASPDATVVVMVIVAAYAAIAFAPRIRVGEGTARLLVRLGALTYPLYLLHSRIGRLLFARLEPRVGTWGALALEAVLIGAASWLVAIAIEERVVPAIARHRWTRRLAGTAKG